MAAKYSDTFGGSGALGNIEVGGVAWQVIAGTWSRTNGYAAATENPNTTPPPIAVIDSGISQVDLSANVSSGGGDALYCRVVDANNWIRARVHYWQTSSSTSSWDGTYYGGSWNYQYSDFTEPGDIDYNWTGDHYYNKDGESGLYTVDEVYGFAVGSGQSYGGSSQSKKWDYYTRQIYKNYVTTTTYYDHYEVVLEKCVAGTITQLGVYSGGGTTSLRLRADGSSIECYVNGTKRISATVADFQTATKHGIGKGTSEKYNSAIDNFTLDLLIPPVPTIDFPTNNSSVNTGVPTLKGTAASWGSSQTKIEYQIASDSAFTADVQLIAEPDTAYRASGQYSLTLTEAQHLTQRGWYIRAHQVSQTGLAGDWSAANYFVVSHAPGVINLAPSGGTKYAATIPLTWQFTDTSSIDSQTAYQVLVERNDNGALVVDTGKVASASQSYDLAVDAALKDVQLRFRVTVWDEEDKASAVSNYVLFTPTDPPVVVITQPADGGTVTTSRPTVTWTFSATGGRSQSYYEVSIQQNGSATVLFDSTKLAGAVNRYDVASPVIKNGNVYDIFLTVTDSVGVSVTVKSTVTATYEEPTIVPFSVDDSTYERNGYVRLTWQAVADAAFVAWRVYRRRVGDQAWTLLKEIPQSTVTEYHDWMVPAMDTYDYYVVQVVLRYDEPVESVVGSPVRIDLGTGGYWMIDPVDPANNVAIYAVTDESYSVVNEQAEFTVVGRGRHVDEGERVGASGSMTAKLRDDVLGTARSKKRSIEDMRAKKKPVYLRNPFGDIIYMALGDISVARIAGTGSSEHVDLTIPYLEIF